jgi:hypothetical protein
MARLHIDSIGAATIDLASESTYAEIEVLSPIRFEPTRSEISCFGPKLPPVDIVFFSVNESVFSFW